MKPKILLTSFQTWLPHQKYNSSDEILAQIQKLNSSSYASLYFLRHLPVNVELASQKLIAEIEYIQPDVIICCGMAEKRDKLTIESNACCCQECLYTAVDLTELCKKLVVTEISHNAGKFVCEGLYYQVLKHIQSQRRKTVCIFVHIPLLENLHPDLVLRDFHLMFFLLIQLEKKYDC
ncbi:MAG: peptidase C15 [Cyanobacteria bacterium P01_G01_bin.19]